MSSVSDVASRLFGLGLLFSAVVGALAVLPVFLFLSDDTLLPTGWGWWWGWCMIAVVTTAILFYEFLGAETTLVAVAGFALLFVFSAAITTAAHRLFQRRR